MARQIPFDLAPSPDFTFDSLSESACNADALALVRGWQNWPAPILLLQGPAGTGKTHMGRAWAMDTSAEIINGAALKINPSGTDFTGDKVFVDDADAADPHALFALINRALEGAVTHLLLSATRPPAAWPHSLPDLHSRLRNTAVATLEEPDDALLEAVMRKMFEDAGRTVSRDLVNYLILRSERSVPGLQTLIIKLDSLARSEKSDLTKAFAARVLNRQPELFDPDGYED